MQSLIIESLPKMMKDNLDGYPSPIKKAVEEAVKEQDGAIRLLVKETLASILTDEKFKQILAERILTEALANSLKR
ncbi:hypothetical protein DFH01_01920 [Falsiroseomonas bella]|uniref:Uncharacterized protein n=1 Tax=Falsiroseomonas bella TaxID=2184016 RepID=A0A317FH14_9PROT|nr:hypothetical protein DFH01_01920 [Falsiroseomonas bella]